MEIPNWMRKTDTCIWCNFESVPIAIREDHYDGEKVVQVDYQCTNDKCEHYKRYNQRAILTVNFEKAIELYREWKKDQSQKKSPILNDNVSESYIK